MVLCLTPTEIHELTDRHTRPAQAVRLRAMGIPFLRDKKDGRIKVLRAVVEKRGGVQRPTVSEAEPDFSWMEKRA